MASYEQVFATPLLRILMEPIALADDLRPVILANETDEMRHPGSPQRYHEGVFESRFDFLQMDNPVVQQYKNTLFSHLGGFVREVNGLSPEELETLRFDCQSWFHVTHNGGYFQPHNHANASWSVIYCVDPGDDKDDDSSHAGHIFIEDPRPAAGMFLDAANRRMARSLSFNALRFRPKKGELIVFPSYLLHSVEPYLGERPRITIAANFWFTRAAQ